MSAQEALVLIGAVVLVLVLWINRDKVKSLVSGGGKRPGGPNPRQK